MIVMIVMSAKIDVESNKADKLNNLPFKKPFKTFLNLLKPFKTF